MSQQTIKLPVYHITIGSDPEVFLSKRTALGRTGAVIGAEKVIPKEGIKTKEFDIGNKSRIIIDGVQAEINPHPFTCRQSMANEIADMMRKLKLVALKKRAIINWDPVVKVTKTELASLSPECRVFGCAPSMNAYDESITLPDPSEYLFRSAGGHIHLGKTGYKADAINAAFDKKNLKRSVKILDIMLGNTCVMLDKNPMNAERRKYYGRAGEFRAPPHGLEYRVLSNFWLRHYVLASFATGLARQALSFSINEEFTKKIMAAVKEEDIRKAINNNDFELAKKNFDKVKGIIAQYAEGSDVPLTKERIAALERIIAKGGISHFFRENPTTHWTKNSFSTGYGAGWESFADTH